MKASTEKNKNFILIRNITILITIIGIGFGLAYNFFGWSFIPKDIFTNYENIDLSDNTLVTYDLDKIVTDSLSDTSQLILVQNRMVDSLNNIDSKVHLSNARKLIDSIYKSEWNNTISNEHLRSFKETFLTDQSFLHQAILGSKTEYKLSEILEIIALESQSYLLSNSPKNSFVLKLIVSTNSIQNLILANQTGVIIYSTDQKLLGQDIVSLYEEVDLNEPKLVWTTTSDAEIASFPLYHSYGFLGRAFVFLNIK